MRRRRRRDAAAPGRRATTMRMSLGPPRGRRRHRDGRRSVGTPLRQRGGLGCWNVAQLLAGHRARVDKLRHAVALGRLDRIEELLLAGCEGERDFSGVLRTRARPLNAEPRTAASRGCRPRLSPDSRQRRRRSTQRAPGRLVERTSSSGSRIWQPTPPPRVEPDRGNIRSCRCSGVRPSRERAAVRSAIGAPSRVTPRPLVQSSAVVPGFGSVLRPSSTGRDGSATRATGGGSSGVGRSRARPERWGTSPRCDAARRLQRSLLRRGLPPPRRRRSMGWCDCGVCRRCSSWWTFLVCWAKRPRWTPRWR